MPADLSDQENIFLSTKCILTLQRYEHYDGNQVEVHVGAGHDDDNITAHYHSTASVPAMIYLLWLLHM